MPLDLQMVGFRVGRESFAVPIAMVHEIVRVPEITSVPNAPLWLEGVMNLRGRIVPVVDLRKRFGEPAERNRRNRVVIAEIEDRLVGLIVDSASEVLKVAVDNIEPPPQGIQDSESTYVSGLAKYRDRLVILVDLTRLLRDNEVRRVENLSAMMNGMGAGGN